MNTELKALISLVVNGTILVQDVLAKKSVITMLAPMFHFASGVPDAVENWSKLKSDLENLTGVAEQADLDAFLQQEFGSSMNNPKAQLLLADILAILQDVSALYVSVQKLQADVHAPLALAHEEVVAPSVAAVDDVVVVPAAAEVAVEPAPAEPVVAVVSEEPVVPFQPA